jgi:hypothetical protein
MLLQHCVNPLEPLRGQTTFSGVARGRSCANAHGTIANRPPDVDSDLGRNPLPVVPTLIHVITFASPHQALWILGMGTTHRVERDGLVPPFEKQAPQVPLHDGVGFDDEDQPVLHDVIPTMVGAI